MSFIWMCFGWGYTRGKRIVEERGEVAVGCSLGNGGIRGVGGKAPTLEKGYLGGGGKFNRWVFKWEREA